MITLLYLTGTAWKVSKYGVISGQYFSVSGLNTEICWLNLRIQSEYRKMRTKNNSVFGQFSRSVDYSYSLSIQKIKQTDKAYNTVNSLGHKIFTRLLGTYGITETVVLRCSVKKCLRWSLSLKMFLKQYTGWKLLVKWLFCHVN